MAKTSQDWAALKVLARHFGWWRAIRLGLSLNKRVRRGEPFGELPAATEEKEIESRAQIASAIILYDILRQTLGDESAYGIVADVVEAAAHVFLSQTIGPLSASALRALSSDERRLFLEERLDRFPNTLVQIEEVGEDEVRFTVNRCRFVRLCADVGVPELTPVFCAVDASYFGQIQPGIHLIRPTTLAEGGANCPFTLRLNESESLNGGRDMN